MNSKLYAAFASLAVAAWLSGCSYAPMAPQPIPLQPGQQPTPHAQTLSNEFACSNGMRAFVRHLGNDRIELQLTDHGSPGVKSAVLTQAVSGSGERYVGNTGLFGRGGEWHQKGASAYLSFTGVHGQSIEVSCTRGR